MSHEISNFWIRIISTNHGNSEFNWYKLSYENLNKNKTIGSNIGEIIFRLQAKYNDTITVLNFNLMAESVIFLRTFQVPILILYWYVVMVVLEESLTEFFHALVLSLRL